MLDLTYEYFLFQDSNKKYPEAKLSIFGECVGIDGIRIEIME